jgi:hypothetical protein
LYPRQLTARVEQLTLRVLWTRGGGVPTVSTKRTSSSTRTNGNDHKRMLSEQVLANWEEKASKNV